MAIKDTTVAYAVVTLLDLVWVNGARRPLNILRPAARGERPGSRLAVCFPPLFLPLSFGLFRLLRLVCSLCTRLLFVASSLGSCAINGRIRGPAESIGAGIAVLRVASRLLLLAVLVFHHKDVAPDLQQLVPANLGRHFCQNAVCMLECPTVSGCAEVQQARVHLL